MSKIQSKWANDPEGRVNNISLAPNAKNTLYPLFEAVMNSIHAIEERFGKDQISKGLVEIIIVRDEDEEYAGFQIRDNGVGFTKKNLESFQMMDSSKKLSIGGKGIGRLLWLKVAKKISISSEFQNGSSIEHIEFDFCIEDPLKNIKYANGSSIETVGATIKLHPYSREYAKVIPKKAVTIANRVLAHFISYFINISHPRISIIDGDNVIDLFDQFTESTERDQDFKFNVLINDKESDFILHCFLLPKAISDDEKSTNAMYLGANGRAVKRFDMDGVFGLKAVEGKFAFLGYVEAESLDRSVNETRTDFSLSDDEIEAIVDEAKTLAKKFLEPELEAIRGKQVKVVSSLRVEHPRFLTVAKTPEEFASGLHLSKQKEEDIYLELSRRSFRDYQRRKNNFRKSVKKALPDLEKKAKEYVDGLQSESISSLAEYVMKRKLILDVFEEAQKYTDEVGQKSEYEEVVHDIICPLRSTADDLNYDDHNLWIIDDRLAFFSYFNSDKQMRAQVESAKAPLKRPDISFFDLGLGFQNNDASQPITIVEFKKPKRDDYTADSNPIAQVREYVDDMRQSKHAKRHDGIILRPITEDTPFMCHIIADITPSLERAMRQLGPFHQKAGTNCYYKWDEGYRTFIEISSFTDVLQSAKARNKAFFAKLGIDL